MSKRLKTYSFILLLANIFLFAHSFIPHNHNHISEKRLEKITCQCSSCSSVEISSKANSEDSDCGCCSKGGKGCFITNGYLSHHSTEINDFSFYIIVSELLIPTPCKDVSIHSYKEFAISPPVEIIVSGIGMRAPPILFS